MNELFRLITLRQPETAVPSVSISVRSSSAFQEQLAGVEGSGKAKWAAIKNAISGALNGNRIVQTVENLNFPEVLPFSFALSSADPPRNLAELNAGVTAFFGVPASQLVADPNFVFDEQSSFDAVVAFFVNPSGDMLGQFVRAVRMHALLRRIAESDATLDDPATIQSAQSVPLLLPSPPFPVNPNQVLPVGIADLLVVKQHPLGYEGGEISHIENVLSGESRDHNTEHSLTTERSFTQENETTTETLRDLQTTDRFSLRAESQNALQETIDVQAGIAVSASYGTLQLNTNASVAYSNSKSASNSTATERAKEVVNRASSKVTERVRTQQTTKTTEVVKQTDLHGFENASDNPNIVGIYQFVNELYRAQVFNYGKRVLFDVVIPEPASFLIDAVTSSGADPSVGNWLKDPGDLTIGPSDLSDNPASSNYFGKYVKQYGAVGVPSPPAQFITVSKSISANKEEDTEQVNDLVIPEGYQALDAVVQGMYNHTGNQAESGLVVYVGTTQYLLVGQAVDASTPNPRSLVTHKESTSIPIAVHAWGASNYAVTVDIKCEITSSAIASWQTKAYDAIAQTYQKRLDDYHDQETRRKLDEPERGALGGSNALQNRATERIELKKSCLAMLSGLDMLAFSGIHEDPTGASGPPPARHFPRIDWPPTMAVPADVAGQGKLIRFFEQAFEWPEMMYFFYPYFWGRKSTWYDRALATHTDPLFAQFLAAGAARVVIPVRPGFESLVNYFLMTGEAWGGGELPSVTDSTYLPITQEIRESSGAPGNEVPVGDPWEVVLPTTLIRLRADATYPAWKQDPPDKWKWVASN